MAALVGAYLIGSVDFGVIVPRLLGVDIYEHGSGNPGTTNVLRHLGRRVAAVVMLGDLAKGFAAAGLGRLVGGETVGFACIFVAVVGHCFPVWHRFRGGKGVAAAGGATFALAPLVAAAVLALWLVVAGVGRRASVASLLVAAAYLPGMLLAGFRGWPIVWAAATVALVTARHYDNMRRLIRGSEHAIEGS